MSNKVNYRCESVYQLFIDINDTSYMVNIIVETEPDSNGEAMFWSEVYSIHETNDNSEEVREVSGDEWDTVNNEVMLHINAVHHYLNNINSN